MNFADRFRYKFLQASYRPRRPKEKGTTAKGYLNSIEDFLTPESEKKKKEKSDKKEANKD